MGPGKESLRIEVAPKHTGSNEDAVLREVGTLPRTSSYAETKLTRKDSFTIQKERKGGDDPHDGSNSDLYSKVLRKQSSKEISRFMKPGSGSSTSVGSSMSWNSQKANVSWFCVQKWPSFLPSLGIRDHSYSHIPTFVGMDNSVHIVHHALLNRIFNLLAVREQGRSFPVIVLAGREGSGKLCLLQQILDRWEVQAAKSTQKQYTRYLNCDEFTVASQFRTFAEDLHLYARHCTSMFDLVHRVLDSIHRQCTSDGHQWLVACDGVNTKSSLLLLLRALRMCTNGSNPPGGNPPSTAGSSGSRTSLIDYNGAPKSPSRHYGLIITTTLPVDEWLSHWVEIEAGGVILSVGGKIANDEAAHGFPRPLPSWGDLREKVYTILDLIPWDFPRTVFLRTVMSCMGAINTVSIDKLMELLPPQQRTAWEPPRTYIGIIWTWLLDVASPETELGTSLRILSTLSFFHPFSIPIFKISEEMLGKISISSLEQLKELKLCDFVPGPNNEVLVNIPPIVWSVIHEYVRMHMELREYLEWIIVTGNVLLSHFDFHYTFPREHIDGFSDRHPPPKGMPKDADRLGVRAWFHHALFVVLRMERVFVDLYCVQRGSPSPARMSRKRMYDSTNKLFAAQFPVPTQEFMRTYVRLLLRVALYMTHEEPYVAHAIRVSQNNSFLSPGSQNGSLYSSSNNISPSKDASAHPIGLNLVKMAWRIWRCVQKSMKNPNANGSFQFRADPQALLSMYFDVGDTVPMPTLDGDDGSVSSVSFGSVVSGNLSPAISTGSPMSPYYKAKLTPTPSKHMSPGLDARRLSIMHSPALSVNTPGSLSFGRLSGSFQPSQNSSVHSLNPFQSVGEDREVDLETILIYRALGNLYHEFSDCRTAVAWYKKGLKKLREALGLDKLNENAPASGGGEPLVVQDVSDKVDVYRPSAGTATHVSLTSPLTETGEEYLSLSSIGSNASPGTKPPRMVVQGSNSTVVFLGNRSAPVGIPFAPLKRRDSDKGVSAALMQAISKRRGSNASSLSAMTVTLQSLVVDKGTDEECVRILQKQLINFLKDVANIYLYDTKDKDGINVLEEVVALEETYYSDPDEGCEDRALTCLMMAMALEAASELDDAMLWYREGLSLFKTAYGKSANRRSEVAVILHNMGCVLCSRSPPMYEDAKNSFSTALEIKLESFETTLHPEVSATLHSLGTVYYSLGEFSRASTLYETVLDIEGRIWGEQRPSGVEEHAEDEAAPVQFCDTFSTMRALEATYRKLGKSTEVRIPTCMRSTLPTKKKASSGSTSVIQFSISDEDSVVNTISGSGTRLGRVQRLGGPRNFREPSRVSGNKKKTDLEGPAAVDTAGDGDSDGSVSTSDMLSLSSSDDSIASESSDSESDEDGSEDEGKLKTLQYEMYTAQYASPALMRKRGKKRKPAPVAAKKGCSCTIL